jgi:hypothetical protein
MNLKTAFEPQRHRGKEEKTRAYVAMPSYLSGEWASVDKLLISCFSLCLCASVVRNSG